MHKTVIWVFLLFRLFLLFVRLFFSWSPCECFVFFCNFICIVCIVDPFHPFIEFFRKKQTNSLNVPTLAALWLHSVPFELFSFDKLNACGLKHSASSFVNTKHERDFNRKNSAESTILDANSYNEICFCFCSDTVEYCNEFSFMLIQIINYRINSKIPPFYELKFNVFGMRHEFDTWNWIWSTNTFEAFEPSLICSKKPVAIGQYPLQMT